jgi:hypothetical protein
VLYVITCGGYQVLHLLPTWQAVLSASHVMHNTSTGPVRHTTCCMAGYATCGIIERNYADPGNRVKASCTHLRQNWTRRDPPRPPGAPSGLSMLASRPACEASPPVGAERLQHSG